MSKYNVTVVEITKSGAGYTGTFTATDTAFLVSKDGTLKHIQATLKGEVQSTDWLGGQIAKIKGTVGQRKGTLVPATVVGTDEVVMVDWTQGHRGAVAAAFSAAWVKLATSGETRMENLTGLKRSTTSGTTVVVNAAQAAEIESLKALVAQQADQMAAFMAMMADKKK